MNVGPGFGRGGWRAWALRALLGAGLLLVASPGWAEGEGAAAPGPGGAPEEAPAAKAAPVVQPPKLVEFVHAEYPAAAQAAGLEAAVPLKIHIDVAGTVSEAEVLEPAGHGFDEAALAAVRRFRFTPASLDGAPVAVGIRFVYRFQLERQPKEPSAPVCSAKLRGIVLERGGRKPLPGMGIRLRGVADPVATDGEGGFELCVAPGRHVVEVLHPDYEPFQTEEEVAAGEALELRYYLEPLSRSRYRSVVTSQRAQKSVTRTQLEDVELVQVPGTFGEPFRVVQALPGVARAPAISTAMIVRGAEPQDTGFFLDGQPMADLYHFMLGPALVHPDLVESIEFFPGNYPISYGRVQSGLVLARTRAGTPVERATGSLSLDFMDLEGIVKVPLGEDTQLAVAGRHSHIDLLVPLVTDNALRPGYWDYQVALDTRLGAWQAKAMLLGAGDSLDYEEPKDSVEDPGAALQLGLGRQLHRINVEARRTLGGWGRLDLSGVVGTHWIDLESNGDALRSTEYYGGLRSELEARLLGDALVLEAGADLTVGRSALSLQLPGGSNFTDFPLPWAMEEGDAQQRRTDAEFDEAFLIPGAWLGLRMKLGPLLLVPGLRLDAFRIQDFQDVTLDPRLVARLALGEALTLKGGVGIFHQRPNGQELSDEYGSPETITSPWALQQSLGVELALPELFELDLTGYYNSYRDQIEVGRVVSQGGQTEQSAAFTNEGEGRSYGLELMLRHRTQSGFFGWVAYTLSRSERRRWDGEWELYGFDQTHILSAVGSYDLGRGWTVGARFRLVSGIPYTPVDSAVFDADTQRWNPVAGSPMSARNALFHQLDLRVDKLFVFDRWKLTTYLDLQNAYNQQNTEMTVYNYDYSERKAITGVPILPSLGVKGEF